MWPKVNLSVFRIARSWTLSGSQSRPGGSEALGKRAGVSDDGSLGPVAQLGERLVCIQEVVGSNPVGSTKIP